MVGTEGLRYLAMVMNEFQLSGILRFSTRISCSYFYMCLFLCTLSRLGNNSWGNSISTGPQVYSAFCLLWFIFILDTVLFACLVMLHLSCWSEVNSLVTFRNLGKPIDMTPIFARQSHPRAHYLQMEFLRVQKLPIKIAAEKEAFIAFITAAWQTCVWMFLWYEQARLVQWVEPPKCIWYD